MSLVGKVGRKRARARFAMAIVYLLLSFGALTTLYPFAVMISTGFKGPTDQNDNKLVPAYWTATETVDGKEDPSSLFSKYLADKYSGDASQIASTRNAGNRSQPEAEDIASYKAWLMALPVDRWSAGFRTPANQVTGRLALRYQAWLREKYGTIQAVNQAYLEENTVFQAIAVPAELLERSRWFPPKTRKYREWREFKETLPAEFRIPVRIDRLWQEFLRAKFENSFDRVPESFNQEGGKRFEDLRFNTDSSWRLTNAQVLREATLDSHGPGSDADKANPTDWNAPRLEHEFYLSLPARLRDTEVRSWPIDAYERNHVRAHRKEIIGEFSARNYAYVLDYVAIHGRALWNTAIFCILAILVQLTVNPLAAYALSRFPIKASAKILLFLLATMAFPAEVAMIPSFLLLKDLGLLNTFAALVLPTAASGYMIFLLKGFFDSLPPELFESGQIDGAKESTMMFRIALPLSKPVLGYLALMAFMGAYGAFLYAFLVAQDQKIWTLMVFIYQLQNSAPKAVMMAALALAALPTLLVFLFAQRAIMRGIILPGEK